jgi:hypothetical protein
MASVLREITIDVPADIAWAALRDWGAVHERLAPGFLVNAEVDGRDRIVTFFNGAAARETFLGADDDARRLAWAVRDGSFGLSHYNGSGQVIPEGDTRVRFIWTADLLPDDLAETVSQLMEQGLTTIKNTLTRN